MKWSGVSGGERVNPKMFEFDETLIQCNLGIHLTWHMGTGVQNNFPMGVKFSTSWGVAPRIVQIELIP